MDNKIILPISGVPAAGPKAAEDKTIVAADKLSLLDLLTRLPVGQLWGFMGVVTGLVVAAFGIGWTVRGAAEDTKLQAAVAKADDLDRRLSISERGRNEEVAKASQTVATAVNERAADAEKVRQLQEKDRFMSLYLRFVIARDKLDDSIPVRVARNALDDYIKGRVERERLVIHKGGGLLATVEFPDGTVWVLPRELHRAVDK